MYLYIYIYDAFNLFPELAFHPKAMLPGKLPGKLPGASRAAVIMRTLHKQKKQTGKPEKLSWQIGKCKLAKLKDEHPENCRLHSGGIKEHGVCFYVRQGRG